MEKTTNTEELSNIKKLVNELEILSLHLKHNGHFKAKHTVDKAIVAISVFLKKEENVKNG